MLSVYVVWGSTYLAIRFAVETIPPYLMAGIRFCIAGGVLYAYRRIGGDRAPLKSHWRSAAIIGLLMLLGGNGSVVWAEQFVPSGIASLMVSSAPLWMVLMDWLRLFNQPLQNKPGFLGLMAVLLGFCGIVILVGPSQLFGLHSAVDATGAAVLTFAALSWAGGSLFSRTADLPSSPLLGSAMEMLCGGAGLLLAGTFGGEWARFDIAAFSARSLYGILYLIIFGSLVGFSSYTWLLRNAPTTLVSTYAYINPVVAIFIGNLLAQEPITPRLALAAFIIIGSVTIITVTQPVSSKKPAATYAGCTVIKE